MLLPVKSGECGLRQSDAVFHHTKQISSVLESLLKNSETFKAIGVSDRPRNIDGSYMPCFLVGKNAFAEIISYTAKTDVFIRLIRSVILRPHCFHAVNCR